MLIFLLAWPGADNWSRDRSAAASLITILGAQADFLTNDRDEDRAKNFWVKDVAGLYGLDPGKGPMQLIHISDAQADRTTGRGRYPSVAGEEPWMGAYWFAALKTYRLDGKSVAYDDGTGRNASRFGLVAFPAKYGKMSRLTFIASEQGTIFSKNTGRKPPEEYPVDPVREGWAVHDSYGRVGTGGVHVSVDPN